MVVRKGASLDLTVPSRYNGNYKLLATDEINVEKFATNDTTATHSVANQTTLSPTVQLYIQNFSLIFLTVQQTLNPIMVRKAHKDAEVNKMEFLSSATVFTTEILRIAMCCTFLCFTHGSIKGFLIELKNTFVKNKRETFKVCIPALIYVIQNNLYFFALKRVEATLFSITYNLRILTTAILSMILLKRVFSFVQWTALFISLLGVILVQISSQQTKKDVENNEEKRRNEFIGLIVIIVMCWSSAFADGIYYGWTYIVWTIAFSSAVSGIVVAAVMKYADNIKKSYCQSVALGGTACLSILLGDSKFSFGLLIGVGLVIISVFLYTINPKLCQQNEEHEILVNEENFSLSEIEFDTDEEIDETR